MFKEPYYTAPCSPFISRAHSASAVDCVVLCSLFLLYLEPLDVVSSRKAKRVETSVARQGLVKVGRGGEEGNGEVLLHAEATDLGHGSCVNRICHKKTLHTSCWIQECYVDAKVVT
jgi:hypothetical protein